MQGAVRKVSTNGGIMSRYLDGRIDLARYQTGCIEMTNQIPADSGLSVTRPGLIYDLRLNRRTVLHPYVVSASVSYLLLFSDRELRIFRNGQLIEVDGSELIITTDYLVDDLYDLKVDSLIDLLWIAHPSYQPKQLSRILETDWLFQDLPYLNPPMIPREGEVVKLTPSGETGDITLTSDQPDFFFAGHVGSYWRVGHDLEAGVVELSLDRNSGGLITSDWLPVSGDWSFTTAGNWIADIRIERRFDGDVKTIRSFKSRSDTQNIASTGTEEAGTELRIVSDNPSGYSQDGTVQAPAFKPSASITVSNTKLYGLVRITEITSGTVAQGTVVRKLYSTDQTELWEEGAWSTHRGYPSTVQEHERRIMFAASRSFPNRYWSSRQGDRQDFELQDDDQSAFSYDLPSRDVISWMLSERQLVIGTRKEEIVVTSGRDDLALSPENSRARINGSVGSSRVQAVKNSDAILYAERRGERIRQLSDAEGSGYYQNTDITAFAPHLLDSYVIQMASAQLDQKLVFVLLSNRKLLCLNHNLDQAMTSWFVIETQGDFESVAALPGDLTEDAVYVVTRRTINGQEVRQLEHFAIDQWELIEKGDATGMVYSDMAKVIESENLMSEITGLEDWEGMEVQVLGDGAVQPNRNVEGGRIDLDVEARKVIIGLPMPSSMIPMWFEDINSPTQGRKRKISKVYISMYQGGNVTLKATDEDTFGVLNVGEELEAFEVARRNLSDEMGAAPQLETQYFEVSLESRHSRKQSVKFERNSPLPMVIQSMHLIYNVGEK